MKSEAIYAFIPAMIFFGGWLINKISERSYRASLRNSPPPKQNTEQSRVLPRTYFRDSSDPKRVVGTYEDSPGA